MVRSHSAVGSIGKTKKRSQEVEGISCNSVIHWIVSCCYSFFYLETRVYHQTILFWNWLNNWLCFVLFDFKELFIFQNLLSVKEIFGEVFFDCCTTVRYHELLGSNRSSFSSANVFGPVYLTDPLIKLSSVSGKCPFFCSKG